MQLCKVRGREGWGRPAAPAGGGFDHIGQGLASVQGRQGCGVHGRRLRAAVALPPALPSFPSTPAADRPTWTPSTICSTVMEGAVRPTPTAANCRRLQAARLVCKHAPPAHLDAQQDLLDGDGGAPALVLVQDAQAHGAAGVDVRVEELFRQLALRGGGRRPAHGRRRSTDVVVFVFFPQAGSNRKQRASQAAAAMPKQQRCAAARDPLASAPWAAWRDSPAGRRAGKSIQVMPPA